MSPSYLPRAIVWIHGNTTKPCIASAMRLNGCFAGLKGFRRVFSRFDKLDVMFTGFIHFALIVDALRMC